MKETKAPIKVAFGAPWKSLHPGEQHTLVADLLLSNQFEALVGSGRAGQLIPLGAKSWEISSDFTSIRFKIDTSKRFSNGELLSAQDFKDSWLASLKLNPAANRSSLLDVFYKVVGFDEFKETGDIKGIVVNSNDELLLIFNTPFRMALDYLKGSRFSAFKNKDGAYYGTGRYIITETQSQLLLTPNPHHPESDSIDSFEISVVQTTDATSALNSGQIDVFAYGKGSDLDEGDGPGNIGMHTGQEALNEAIFLNPIKGRFFKDKQLRQGFQAFVFQAIKNSKETLGNKKYFSVDPQIYLPFQPGRISEEDAEQIILENNVHIDSFLEANKQTPLTVYFSDVSKPIFELLVANGLNASSDSREIQMSEFFNIIYKTFEPDIMFGAFSVAGGDPDGAYHILGKNGALSTPMIFNEKVAAELEIGRSVLDRDAVDKQYQKATRAFLTEVPFVHIGFSKAVALFNSDNVYFEEKLIRRNEGHLHVFKRR